MGWLSIINSVTNISRLGTFKVRNRNRMHQHSTTSCFGYLNVKENQTICINISDKGTFREVPRIRMHNEFFFFFFSNIVGIWSKSGTKNAPLFRIWEPNRGCVILSVSNRNVSAAHSLQNKVFIFLYSRKQNFEDWVRKSALSQLEPGIEHGQHSYIPHPFFCSHMFPPCWVSEKTKFLKDHFKNLWFNNPTNTL